jgi:hypothetical protein
MILVVDGATEGVRRLLRKHCPIEQDVIDILMMNGACNKAVLQSAL